MSMKKSVVKKQDSVTSDYFKKINSNDHDNRGGRYAHCTVSEYVIIHLLYIMIIL